MLGSSMFQPALNSPVTLRSRSSPRYVAKSTLGMGWHSTPRAFEMLVHVAPTQVSWPLPDSKRIVIGPLTPVESNSSFGGGGIVTAVRTTDARLIAVHDWGHPARGRCPGTVERHFDDRFAVDRHRYRPGQIRVREFRDVLRSCDVL